MTIVVNREFGGFHFFRRQEGVSESKLTTDKNTVQLTAVPKKEKKQALLVKG